MVGGRQGQVVVAGGGHHVGGDRMLAGCPAAGRALTVETAIGHIRYAEELYR